MPRFSNLDVLVHARIHKLYYCLQQNALQQQKRLTAILETAASQKTDNSSQINTNETTSPKSSNLSAPPKSDGSEEDDGFEIDVELNIMAEEQEEFESELYSIRTTLLGTSRVTSSLSNRLGLDRVGPGRPKPTMLKKDQDKLTIFLQRINWPNTVVLTIPKTSLISELKVRIDSFCVAKAVGTNTKFIQEWRFCAGSEASAAVEQFGSRREYSGK